MRELTQQEIDNAPEWATGYFITPGFNGVTYESHEFYQYLPCGSRVEQLSSGLSVNAKPIPRKEFDISEYEFSDSEVEVETNEDGTVWLCAVAYSSVNKRDAIALAKHFKLTAEDLK